MKATRRSARERAIQMLVAADLNPPEDVRLAMDAFWEMAAVPDEENDLEAISGKLRLFAEERVAGVMEKRDAIDEKLEAILDNWDIYRLGTVERAVLRMGIWEIDSGEIPVPVVINEAIDLVNWFSSPKSRTIVNGVLDRYAKNRAKAAAGAANG